MDKIEQNQLLVKTWMQEQFQSIAHISTASKSEVSPDSTLVVASTDILTNLQLLQSTLQGLRRMADTLQSSINTVKVNLTDLTNLTRYCSKDSN